MSEPLLSDLDDFVIDLNGVVEDQFVAMGFKRSVARLMVSGLSDTWRVVMQENMK